MGEILNLGGARSAQEDIPLRSCVIVRQGLPQLVRGVDGMPPGPLLRLGD